MITSNKPQVFDPTSLLNTVGEELADILEAHGVTDFENVIGVTDLKKKEKLSRAILTKASKAIDCPEIIDLLTGFQKRYSEEKIKCVRSYKQSKKIFNQLKSIVPLLKGQFTQGCDVLDDIVDFFGANSEEDILSTSEAQMAMFRKNDKININPINLHGWLRRGELDFQEMKDELASYDEKKLIEWVEGKDWEDKFEDQNYFKSLPKTFANFGVALIFTSSLPNTVYGAVRWIDGRPLIQISDRDKDLAACWFTLFHEIGHVILHKDFDSVEYEINKEKENICKKEKEANKFANEHLFKGDSLRKAVFKRQKDKTFMSPFELAKEFEVSHIFAAYWMRKAKVGGKDTARKQIVFM